MQSHQSQLLQIRVASKLEQLRLVREPIEVHPRCFIAQKTPAQMWIQKNK